MYFHFFCCLCHLDLDFFFVVQLFNIIENMLGRMNNKLTSTDTQKERRKKTESGHHLQTTTMICILNHVHEKTKQKTKKHIRISSIFFWFNYKFIVQMDILWIIIIICCSSDLNNNNNNNCSVAGDLVFFLVEITRNFETSGICFLFWKLWKKN